LNYFGTGSFNEAYYDISNIINSLVSRKMWDDKQNKEGDKAEIL
jgi:hypothetical protein